MMKQLLGLVVFCSLSCAAAAGDIGSYGLELISLLEECEEEFREGEWSESADYLHEARVVFKEKLVPLSEARLETQGNAEVGRRTAKSIGAILDSLGKSIEQQNAIKAETRHRGVTKYLFVYFNEIGESDLIVEKFKGDTLQLVRHYEAKNSRDLRTETNEIFHSLKNVAESNPDIAALIPISPDQVESMLVDLREQKYDNVGVRLKTILAGF